MTALGGFLGGCGNDRSRPPILAGEVGDAELRILHLAEQILLRDCMRHAGFELQISVFDSTPEAREFRYVIDDVAWAGKHGYGTDIQREMTRLRETDPNQRYFQSLKPERKAAALKAANGERPEGLTATTPDGNVLTRSDQSCRSHAERTLYGDLKTWFQAKSTTSALADIRSDRVTADPRFTAAIAPWADCMRTAGHPYLSPAQLRAALPPSEQPLPRDQEVGLAVTEARCALSSGLAETTRTLDQHYDRELRQQHHAALTAERRLQLAALPRARSIAETANTSQERGPQPTP